MDEFKSIYEEGAESASNYVDTRYTILKLRNQSKKYNYHKKSYIEPAKIFKQKPSTIYHKIK